MQPIWSEGLDLPALAIPALKRTWCMLKKVLGINSSSTNKNVKKNTIWKCMSLFYLNPNWTDVTKEDQGFDLKLFQVLSEAHLQSQIKYGNVLQPLFSMLSKQTNMSQTMGYTINWSWNAHFKRSWVKYPKLKLKDAEDSGQPLLPMECVTHSTVTA